MAQLVWGAKAGKIDYVSLRNRAALRPACQSSEAGRGICSKTVVGNKTVQNMCGY